ncbi:DUF4366 domain-containing protein [Criibacterium bergeronii]|uniref:DUF4366 domain-containing protein n=1 Tax=Criibacterium bergeronii TaxID=1871336 RepID=A0A552UZ20_9FIRM|nr:DUF4366 domain-containing protein [Criibacterium bergeronii]TRW23459.1 DUF4366 domain-containing protein [Criibacterium bergeronii]
MKNKIIMRITTALFAALILMGGFSIPAYANGDGDATNDSNVKTEEKKEEKKPLTPDGNMSLIDNIKGDAAKDKEFIIVKSRGGNYFYIVIDHAAQGENTVHFLNQVDEKDLLSIIDEKSSLTAKPELPKQEQPKQETEKPKPEEKPEKKNPAGMIAISLILILGLAGGAFYYFKFLKPKQNVKGTTDLDEFDFEDYEDDFIEDGDEDGEEISEATEPDETV